MHIRCLIHSFCNNKKKENIKNSKKMFKKVRFSMFFTYIVYTANFDVFSSLKNLLSESSNVKIKICDIAGVLVDTCI